MDIYAGTAKNQWNFGLTSNSTYNNASSSLQRLSSSIRIASATTSDVSTATTAPTNTKPVSQDYSQSIKDANNAVGALQIANGAINEQSKITSAIKVKANLAAQDGQTMSSINSIRQDIGRLMQKLDSIAKVATDNASNLTNSAFVNQTFQVGGSTKTMQDLMASSTSSILGKVQQAQTSSAISTTGDLSVKIIDPVNNSTTTINPTIISSSADTGLAQLASAINNASSQTGVSAVYSATSTASASVTAGNISGLVINGTSIGDINNVQAGDSSGALVGAINKYSSTTGVVASIDSQGKLTLNSSSSQGIALSESSSSSTSTSLGATTTPNNYYSVSQINEFGIATKYVNLNTGAEVSASTINTNDSYVNQYYKTQSGAYRDATNGAFMGFNAPTYANNPYTASFPINYDTDGARHNRQHNNGNSVGFALSGVSNSDRNDASSHGNSGDNSSSNNENSNNNQNNGFSFGQDLQMGRETHSRRKSHNNGDNNFLSSASSYLDMANGGKSLSVSQIESAIKAQTSDGGGVSVSSPSNVLGFGSNSVNNAGSISIVSSGNTQVEVSTAGGSTNVTQNASAYHLSDILTALPTAENIYASNKALAGSSMATTIATSAVSQLDTIKSDIKSNIDALNASIAGLTNAQTSSPATKSQVQNMDYASISKNFDKSNVLSQNGSLIQAQARTSQESVAKLLFVNPPTSSAQTYSPKPTYGATSSKSSYFGISA